MRRALLPLALSAACVLHAAEAPPPAPTAGAKAAAQLEQRLAALRKQGTGFALRGRYEALLADASEAGQVHAADPTAARAFYVISRCCEALGKHPEKEAAFERYVEILVGHAKDRAATELRAEVERLVASRELFPALKLLRVMLAKFPDGPEAAFALYRLGTCHLWMDRHDDAVAALSEVVARWPKDAIAGDAALRLARAHLARRTPGEAVPVLERFLAANPKAPQRDAAIFDLAAARYAAADYFGALVGFQHLLQDAPKSPYAPIAQAYVAALRAQLLQRIGD